MDIFCVCVNILNLIIMNSTSIIITYSVLLVVFLALTFITLYTGLKIKNIIAKTSLILLSILLVVAIIFGTIGFVYYKDNNDSNNGNNINTIPNQSIGSSTIIRYLPPQNRYVGYWNIYDNGWWWNNNNHHGTNVNIHNYNSNKPHPTTNKSLPAPTIATTTTTKPASIIPSTTTTTTITSIPTPTQLLNNIPPSQIPQYTGITAEQLMSSALSSMPVSAPIVESELPFTPVIPTQIPSTTA